MRLSRLLRSVDKKEMVNFSDVEVEGISCDSRAVKSGDLFVAVSGVTSNGHRFVSEAVERGAVACVTEERLSSPAVPNVVVTDSAKVLAIISARFFGNASQSLWMCGVTGTNGKTSTAHLLRSICENASWGRLGVIGTIGHGSGDALSPALHTTPDAVTLHRLLRDMKREGCSGVVMEVSSHAVRQQRTWGIDFEVGILTNVTRDHLDYHYTLEDYISAKREFCYSLVSVPRKKGKGVLVFSVDDPVAREIGESFRGDKVSVGCGRGADVFAEEIEASIRGTNFVLSMRGEKRVPIRLKLLGSFSVSNALLAAGAASTLGIGLEGIKKGLESLTRVPGRFESLGGGDLPLVIVDYCHTPDSLERALKSCRDLKPRRLITVFGCGGDRDRGKRPVMGGIAQRLSDICYVTSDNPRTEEPGRIIEDILAGMDSRGGGLFIEVDRRKAIRRAILGARKGELVAICGKGHEDYQIVGDKRRPFDDREEAGKALSMWGRS